MEYKKFEDNLRRKLSDQEYHIDENLLFKNLGIAEKSNKKRLLWYLLIPIALIFTIWVCSQILEVREDNTKENVKGEAIKDSKYLYPNQDGQLQSPSEENNRNKSISILHENTILADSREDVKVYSNDIVEKKNITSLKKQNTQSIAVKKIEFFNTTQDEEVLNNLLTTNEKLNENIIEKVKENRNETREKVIISSLKHPQLNALTINENEIIKLNKVKICYPTFDHRNIILGLGFELGVGDLHSTLKTDHSGMPDIDERLDAERALEETQFKLYGLIKPRKISGGLKSGISIHRYSNQFKRNENYVKIDTTKGLISTTISPIGDTITHIYGDILTETKVNKLQNYHYYLYKIDIPVSFYYSYHLGSWNIQTEMGIQFNIRTWSDGYIYNTDGTFVPVNELNEIRKNVGLSYFGQINFVREIGIGYQLYAAPYLYLSPKDHSYNEISNKYHSAGIKFGFQKVF